MTDSFAAIPPGHYELFIGSGAGFRVSVLRPIENDTALSSPRPSVPLEPDSQSTKLLPATPSKRKRGKCMSRRAQVGSEEISGKWYVVRFWKDIPGQEGRVHACERICPISGPESLNKSERKRKRLEIVMRSGVNSPEQYSAMTNGITFREQAEKFMHKARTRKRKPVKPKTLCTWQNCLEKWLNPNLGDMPLASVNNAALKALVARMHAAGLSAKTIVNYAGLVKLVVASAVDEEGELLFPRKWNHEFIDMPIVENQHQPTFNAETMSSIVANAPGQERVLYALLAGSGLRIGEVLGLEIGKHISEDCRTLLVRQSVWEAHTQAPKTRNAIRDVDICAPLAAMLKSLVGERKAGFVFANRVGKPFSQTNLLRRSLHPILEDLGLEKAGFHAFRRFRTTYLRKNRAPEDLIRFWLGHANKTVTDEYAKLFEDMEFRREVAESVGIGFTLPPVEGPIVRNVRRKSKQSEVEVAA
jgi:integrase